MENIFIEIIKIDRKNKEDIYLQPQRHIIDFKYLCKKINSPLGKTISSIVIYEEVLHTACMGKGFLSTKPM